MTNSAGSADLGPRPDNYGRAAQRIRIASRVRGLFRYTVFVSCLSVASVIFIFRVPLVIGGGNNEGGGIVGAFLVVVSGSVAFWTALLAVVMFVTRSRTDRPVAFVSGAALIVALLWLLITGAFAANTITSLIDGEVQSLAQVAPLIALSFVAPPVALGYAVAAVLALRRTVANQL